MSIINLFYNILFHQKTYTTNQSRFSEKNIDNLHMWLYGNVIPFAHAYKFTRKRKIIVLCQITEDSFQDEFLCKIKSIQDIKPEYLKPTFASAFQKLSEMNCNPSFNEGSTLNSFLGYYACHDRSVFMLIEPP